MSAAPVPVRAAGLSTRTRNLLLRHGICDLDELAGCPVDELRELRGLGAFTLAEVADVLAAHALERPHLGKRQKATA